MAIDVITSQLTYSRCQELFKTCRNKNAGKPIARNTRLLLDAIFNDTDDFLVKYHNTIILRIHRDGTYTYNNGEFYTMSTKERLNTFGPLSIYQEQGVWYIGQWHTANEERVTYFNGMKVNSKGKILNRTKEILSIPAKSKKFTKLVSAYIRGFVEDIKKNGLAKPNSGDCWACLTMPKNGFKVGGIVENEPMGFDHYLSHFEEKYYVPSLLFKAMIEKGHGEPGHMWSLCKDQSETFVPMILRWFFNRRRHHIINCMGEGK